MRWNRLLAQEGISPAGLRTGMFRTISTTRSVPRPGPLEILDTLLRAKRQDADAALIEAIDMLTAKTGENRFRHAASVVRGKVLGRHTIDDKAAVRRIAAFPALKDTGTVAATGVEAQGPHRIRPAGRSIG
jgi:hypothetical protein